MRRRARSLALALLIALTAAIMVAARETWIWAYGDAPDGVGRDALSLEDGNCLVVGETSVAGEEGVPTSC